MPTKAELSSLLQATQDEILLLASSLTESERSTSGSADNWGPRDVLAHLGHGKRFLASDLAAARRGETPPQGDLPERSNAAIYEVFKDRAWDDIANLLDEAHRELAGQLQAFSDEELNDPDRYSWLDGAPLWRRIAGQAFVHATVHLFQTNLARGDKEAARRVAQLEGEQGLAFDPSDRWQGLVHYNQGCYNAVLGDRETALRELEQGFRLAPQFIEFAQQDTDLDSLRDDPTFVALQKQGDQA